MKVARLSIKNYLGIKEAVIEPKKVTVISGKNGMGKSSILKALQAVFKGTSITEIHKGTERAELIAELEDIQVVRVQTQKTSSVTVKTKDGFTRNAPQKFLDGLLGGFAFNPLSFLLSPPKERRDVLLKAMDITVTAGQIQEAADGVEVPAAPSGPALEQYAEAHGWFYRQRTDSNRRLKQKQGAITETAKKLPDGFKPDENLQEKKKAVSGRLDALGKRVAVLQEERAAAERAEKTRKRILDEQKSLQARFEELGGMIDSITYSNDDAKNAIALVADLEKKLEVARKNRDHIVNERQRRVKLQEEMELNSQLAEKNHKTLDELPPPFDASRITEAQEEADGLRKEFDENEKQTVHAHTFAELSILKEEAQALEEESDRLTALVEKFGRELPAKALAEAKLPIADLALDGEEITVNGIPIEQLATSEQIAVTLSIARALSKELPLVCIDGVERLDEEAFAEFIRQAEDDGFQYFVTRVGAPREGEIEVREGKVAVQ